MEERCLSHSPLAHHGDRSANLARDLLEHDVDFVLPSDETLDVNGPANHERILVCMTPRANLNEMLAEAKAAADSFHGELIVAYVRQPNISDADQSALDARLAIAIAAGAHVEILEGDDPAHALLDFARSRGVTQLFVGHSQRSGLARLRASPLDKLIWEGHGMDVRVFPQ